MLYSSCEINSKTLCLMSLYLLLFELNFSVVHDVNNMRKLHTNGRESHIRM